MLQKKRKVDHFLFNDKRRTVKCTSTVINVMNQIFIAMHNVNPQVMKEKKVSNQKN